ncbi:MAG: helix-hairpin-helix domain-containing protein, partial [Planctomycetia bacterium]
MDRGDVANILEECAVLLELQGENPFRFKAYQNAARAVQQLDGDLKAMVDDGTLSGVKGIGDKMAAKIAELVKTGGLAAHAELRAAVPPGLLDMLRINGFGPKKAKQVYDELGVDSVAALKAACLDGRLVKLKGFAAKSVEKILAGVEFLDKAGQRVLYPVARRLADRLVERLKNLPQVQRLAVC